MTPEEEAHVLARACVPEHIVSLMTLISGGEAFLMGDYLGYAGDGWLIVVGYPLEGPFSGEACGQVVERAVEIHRPEVLRFIGPELPPVLRQEGVQGPSDAYYLLDLDRSPPSPSLLRAAGKAALFLSVARERAFSSDHERLAAEFLEGAKAAPLVRALYLAMPRYVGRSPTGWTLSARDAEGRLLAFFVVDLGAPAFSTFLIGARSRTIACPHASDLLFAEMIQLTRESGRDVINLGLGVNAGIRRFKEKWGGRPALSYTFCERRYRAQGMHAWLSTLLKRL